MTCDCTCQGHLGQHDIHQIIPICGALPKVAKNSYIETVMCHCHWCYRIKLCHWKQSFKNKVRSHWQHLLAIMPVTATCDCTCLGHLVWCNTDRIISMLCFVNQGLPPWVTKHKFASSVSLSLALSQQTLPMETQLLKISEPDAAKTVDSFDFNLSVLWPFAKCNCNKWQ